MDNLTHTLVGVALGHAGLKRYSGLAMPALVIGANLPDVDATCALLGTQSLALRRGVTHGPIAMVLLPLLLAGALVAHDRWQRRRGTRPATRPPVRPRMLLLLSIAACLTHPALDWLNSYGIRLLEPFSSRWYYGDALFIVDWMLWLVLGSSAWISWRREKRGQPTTIPARAALACSAAYILANVSVSGAAVGALTANDLGRPHSQVVVANPVPLAWWERDLLYGEPNAWQRRRWSLLTGLGSAAPIGGAKSCALPAPQQLAGNADALAFLFWSRMPFAEMEQHGGLVLRDARFSGSFAPDRFSVPTSSRCAVLEPA